MEHEFRGTHFWDTLYIIQHIHPVGNLVHKRSLTIKFLTFWRRTSLLRSIYKSNGNPNKSRKQKLHRLALYFQRLDLLKIDGVLVFNFSNGISG